MLSVPKTDGCQKYARKTKTSMKKDEEEEGGNKGMVVPPKSSEVNFLFTSIAVRQRGGGERSNITLENGGGWKGWELRMDFIGKRYDLAITSKKKKKKRKEKKKPFGYGHDRESVPAALRQCSESKSRMLRLYHYSFFFFLFKKKERETSACTTQVPPDTTFFSKV
eukprot:TRINITY_DN3576_c0_g1_i1.p1 TRINITY_DN3576_c0_g1~~TRINITY_DN3576_c0_g1_i1.p1  ORF type:complete len:166 (-),score=14.16 TRINITY_DN3576_c0_g1_i1:296-793(-)